MNQSIKMQDKTQIQPRKANMNPSMPVSPVWIILIRFIAIIATSTIFTSYIEQWQLIINDDIETFLLFFLPLIFGGGIGAIILHAISVKSELLSCIGIAAFLVLHIVSMNISLTIRTTLVMVSLLGCAFFFILLGFDHDTRFPRIDVKDRVANLDVLQPIGFISGFIFWFIAIQEEYIIIGKWIFTTILIGTLTMLFAFIVLKTKKSRKMEIQNKMTSQNIKESLKSALHGANWWRLVITMMTFILLVYGSLEDIFLEVLKFLVPDETAIEVIPKYQLYSFAYYGIMIGTLGAAMSTIWAKTTEKLGPSLIIFFVSTGIGVLITLFLREMAVWIPIIAFFATIAFILGFLIMNAGTRENS